MTRLEKCKIAIEKGFKYCPETGIIFTRRGYTIKNTTQGYLRLEIHLNKRRYFLMAHHFAWYIINNSIVDEIDHINRIRTDNRICNLRSVTKSQNHLNRGNVKGYSYIKDERYKSKYRARIKINGKLIDLGIYKTEKEAIKAYETAKKKYI